MVLRSKTANPLVHLNCSALNQIAMQLTMGLNVSVAAVADEFPSHDTSRMSIAVWMYDVTCQKTSWSLGHLSPCLAVPTKPVPLPCPHQGTPVWTPKNGGSTSKSEAKHLGLGPSTTRGLRPVLLVSLWQAPGRVAQPCSWFMTHELHARDININLMIIRCNWEYPKKTCSFCVRF